MAELQAIRDALERIGFSEEASDYITGDQGLDEVEEFRILSDSEVENLCKNTRRPGGIINNPNRGRNNPATIPNPGVPVSLKAENNLKLMCYYIRHQDRVSRTVRIQDIDSEAIRNLRHLREEEDKHEDPGDLPTIGRDWARNMETIKEWIRQYIGVTGVSLQYVLRTPMEVKPEAEDDSDNYDSLMEEMIARAPILSGGPGSSYSKHFTTDNGKVWDLISSLLREKDCWAYMKHCQRSHDGRGAFWSLHNHYLGPNTIDNQAAAAKKTLQTLTYKGETRRWNFESYVTAHKQQHQILEELVRLGYRGIDERAKVRHLMAGIKDSSLNVIKSQILANAEVRQDFDKAVNLYKDYIHQEKTHTTPTFQIAAVHAEVPQQSDQQVEDRYYTVKEYQKLSDDQKEQLRQMRMKRGKKRKGGRGGEGRKPNHKRFKHQIATIVAEIMDSRDRGTGDTETPSTISNRDHPALTRQSGNPKRK